MFLWNDTRTRSLSNQYPDRDRTCTYCGVFLHEKNNSLSQKSEFLITLILTLWLYTIDFFQTRGNKPILFIYPLPASGGRCRNQFTDVSPLWLSSLKMSAPLQKHIDEISCGRILLLFGFIHAANLLLSVWFHVMKCCLFTQCLNIRYQLVIIFHRYDICLEVFAFGVRFSDISMKVNKFVSFSLFFCPEPYYLNWRL